VPIQRRRIELSEHIDLGHIAVQAVANRDINQPIVCSKRNSWLCPLLRQWIKPSPSTTSKYNAKHTLQTLSQSEPTHIQFKHYKIKINKKNSFFQLDPPHKHKIVNFLIFHKFQAVKVKEKQSGEERCKLTLLASGSRQVWEFWESETALGETITGLRTLFGAIETESAEILSPQSCDAEKERLRGTVFLPPLEEEEAEHGTLREPIAAIDAMTLSVR